MNKLTIILSIAFLIIACGSNGSDTSNKSTKPPGEKLYKKNCIICHGASGDAQINGAKDITVSKLNLEERVTLIKNGKGLMTPFKGLLTDKQMKAVAEFSMTLSK